MNPLNHVAIIMDGNGRWGLKRNKSRNFGHKEGLKSIENIINISIQKKIKFLTLFVFSTDNWNRPKKEINYLFDLLTNFLSSVLLSSLSSGTGSLISCPSIWGFKPKSDFLIAASTRGTLFASQI